MNYVVEAWCKKDRVPSVTLARAGSSSFYHSDEGNVIVLYYTIYLVVFRRVGVDEMQDVDGVLVAMVSQFVQGEHGFRSQQRIATFGLQKKR